MFQKYLIEEHRKLGEYLIKSMNLYYDAWTEKKIGIKVCGKLRKTRELEVGRKTNLVIGGTNLIYSIQNCRVMILSATSAAKFSNSVVNKTLARKFENCSFLKTWIVVPVLCSFLKIFTLFFRRHLKFCDIFIYCDLKWSWKTMLKNCRSRKNWKKRNASWKKR